MTLVGRDVEIAALRGVLEELAHGRGRGVLIEGEPGSGKSALLDTLLRGAECTVRSASCVEADGQAPLAALLSALRSRPPDAATEAVAVGHVLTLVDELCARGPLLLAVDDLHSADEASLLVWQRLCAVAARSPLLLVGTLRPLPRRAEIDRIRLILKDNDGLILALDRLPPDAVAELAGRLLGAAPASRLAARLESAGGNPSLVRELVAADSAQDVDALALVVADRIERNLGDAVKEVLRTAALLGTEFSVTELSAVLRRPAGTLATAVQEALAGGVLEPVGPRLRFRHGLLRQALRESTPGPVRAGLQLIAIRALMDSGAPVERVAELIAEDLAIADGWETAWVARHAEQLARRAPDLAADIFEHVLGRPGTAEDRAALLDGFATLSFTLFGLGRRDEAERLAARIEAEPGLPPIWHARLAARAARTPRDAARVLAEGERLSDPMTIGYAIGAEAALRFRAADPTGCLDAVERALRAIGPPPRLPECRSALIDIRSAADADLAYREGRWDDALAGIDSVTDRAELHGLAAVIALHRDDERTANASLRALSDQDPYALLARAAYAERADRPDEARDLISGLAAARRGASVTVRLGLVDADARQLAAEVERLRAANRPAELCQTLEELAVRRARDGDETGAREASAEALARYADLGAAWDARRTLARLRAHGVRIGGRAGRRPRTGPKALTESELRVAEFLGKGMSNPDIAAELLLSRRTVESHVSRILAKLGVRNRREAAEVLRRE
jgi:DNA-binding CsgD family transcriptional regulator